MDPGTVIVGASLAGLYCACRLAANGERVVVVEQAGPERKPQRRTLIVTAELLSLLPEVEEEGLVRNRIFRFRLRADGRAVQVPLNEPDLIVDRSDLIALLTRLAQNRGTTIRWAHNFLGLVPTREGLGVELWDRAAQRRVRLCAKNVVAGDGAASEVARVAELNSRPRVPILQAKVKLRPHQDPSTVDTWFDPGSTRYFYWLIPDSPRTAAVGLAADEPRQARQALLSFLKARGLEPYAMEAAWVSLFPARLQPERTYGAGKVYLVGDSAGQVKDSTVGGTVTGLKGAAAAAQAILTGTPYREELRGLRRELLAHHLVRSFLNRFTHEDYRRLFDALSPRVLSVLSCRNRDHLASMLFTLVLAQPRLLSLAARALFRPGQRKPDLRR